MSQPTVLVVSAGGHTGLPTVLELLHRGYPVRALVHRDDARAERLRQHGAQVVVGSLDDPIDVTGALAGVQRAYFAPPFAPGALRVSSIFAEAADAARLEVIVALSLWLAHPTHPSVHAREDWLAVQRFAALPDTGVVTVNPGWFADNYMAGLTMAAQLGLFAMPLGEGRNAPPSNEDIARVIVGALADPTPHLGQALRPTGPALLTPGEIAATFARVMGHRVRYLDTRPALFAKVMRAFGFPDYVSASVLTFLEEYRRDTFAIGAPTDVVERVGGRPPEDFETIVRRYVAAAPSGRRSPGGLVRMLGTFARVLATRAPDVDAVARTCGVGNRDHAVLAVDSAEWRATHGPATDTAAAQRAGPGAGVVTGPSLIAEHYGQVGIRERISTALVATGRHPGRLAVDDTALLDEFHTLGRPATVALAELAGVTGRDRVLDIGAGLGGAARYLADRFGCRVSTIDATPVFCDIAGWLNVSTGLADRISVVRGDARSLPFAAGSFDLAWTQHVQMNIADKATFYREIRRVLADGGRLALWEIVAGGGASKVRYPVPWADSREVSFLVSADGLKRELRAAGFEPATWNDLTEKSLLRLQPLLGAPPQPLGLHVVVPGLPAKASNLVEGLADGSLRLIQAIAIAA